MVENMIDVINPNPAIFENLASCLATATAHTSETGGDLGRVVQVYEAVFKKSLRQPLNYPEVTELAGDGMKPTDRCAGRGAWILMNTARLHVEAVHTNIWDSPSDKRSAVDNALLRLIARRLGTNLAVSSERLGELRDAAISRQVGKLGMLGWRDGEIWAVEAISSNSMVKGDRQTRLFNDPVLEERHLATLHDIWCVLTECFPDVKVVPAVLVTHRRRPQHFDLYGPRFQTVAPEEVVLTSDLIIDSAVNHRERLDDDAEALWTMPRLIDDPLFRCLPPCRGSRTLGLLAAIACRQLEESELLTWTEKQLGDLYRETCGYAVARDKVRHDIGDRLIAQWFVKRRRDIHYLTVQGMARYLYSLAKYTTCGPSDHMEALDKCVTHTYRIINKYQSL